MSTHTTHSGTDRPGWLTFAGVVMYSVGVLQLISAIYFLNNSRRINDLSHGAFGTHAWVWGVWALVLAALSVSGAYSLMQGHRYGRVITYLWAGMMIVEGFLMLGQSPGPGVITIALAALVMYALATTSGWTAET
jgi:hypothetical protein